MILAIDPGNTESAYVTYDCAAKRPVTFGKVPNAEILEIIYDWNRPVFIEMIASYGMAVGKEVFETCVWIGRFAQATEPFNANLVYRRDVKLHMCGNVRAKDANIIQAIKDLYGGESCKGTKANPGPLFGIKADCWQALALAITAAETK